MIAKGVYGADRPVPAEGPLGCAARRYHGHHALVTVRCWVPAPGVRAHAGHRNPLQVKTVAIGAVGPVTAWHGG